MEIIDLFAGAGGMSEGFKRAGFDVVAHVESDTSAAETLKTREAYYFCKKNGKLDVYNQYVTGQLSKEEFYSYIPESTLNKVINIEISNNNMDTIIEKINSNISKQVIGIIGGPPCQAYSVVGRARDKNGMKKDPRNFLYIHYLKFIEKFQPQFFVFENVEGLLSAQKGDIFTKIQEGMKALGYDIGYQLLNAKDFGVLQNRKRIIIVGWKKKLKRTYPQFIVQDVKYTIADLFDDLPAINAGEYNNKYKGGKISKCLGDLKIRDVDSILTYHKSRKNRPIDLEIYKICADFYRNNNKNIRYNELPAHLITHNNKKSFLDRFKVVPKDSVSHTIVAHIAKDGHHFIHPDSKQNRSITVREAARIQSFPDDFYFESSQTSAFKQIGNAVPPLMAEIIANKIKEMLI